MGASLEDIRLWLRCYKRIRITRRAILYRLRRWDEEKACLFMKRRHFSSS